MKSHDFWDLNGFNFYKMLHLYHSYVTNRQRLPLSVPTALSLHVLIRGLDQELVPEEDRSTGDFFMGFPMGFCEGYYMVNHG